MRRLLLGRTLDNVGWVSLTRQASLAGSAFGLPGWRRPFSYEQRRISWPVCGQKQPALTQRRPLICLHGLGYVRHLATFTPPNGSLDRATILGRLKRVLLVYPAVEAFLLRSRVVEDRDLATVSAKAFAVVVYGFGTLTLLGTLGIDTRPLLAGAGVTGFAIGFAMREVASNFLSGILLIINRPFQRGEVIHVLGAIPNLKGRVEEIDFRHVRLRTEDQGLLIIPSFMVFSNPVVVHRAEIRKEDTIVVPPTASPTATGKPQ